MLKSFVVRSKIYSKYEYSKTISNFEDLFSNKKH